MSDNCEKSTEERMEEAIDKRTENPDELIEPDVSEKSPNGDRDNDEGSPNRVGGMEPAASEHSPAKTESDAKIVGGNLEPVGHVEAETVENELTRGVVKYGAGDGLAELPEGTPLFTARGFIELVESRIEKHNDHCREVKDRAKDPDDELPFEVAEQEVKERFSKIRELETLLEEFTQNGGTE